MTDLIDLRNETDFDFNPVVGEISRTYFFTDGEFEVEGVQWLSVSESGGHRLLTADGLSVYVKPTWFAITWEVEEDAPHFSV